MQQIYEAFTNEYPEIQTTLQQENLSETEKQLFLNKFSNTQELHVYFCVLGGMFSEGIDLKGDLLIGAILIGVGLPQINPQQELVKEHFQKENQMLCLRIPISRNEQNITSSRSCDSQFT